MSGTTTFSIIPSSDSSSLDISKYASTSVNTCEAIGAATPPPWVIITTHLQPYILWLYFHAHKF